MSDDDKFSVSFNSGSKSLSNKSASPKRNKEDSDSEGSDQNGKTMKRFTNFICKIG